MQYAFRSVSEPKVLKMYSYDRSLNVLTPLSPDKKTMSLRDSGNVLCLVGFNNVAFVCCFLSLIDSRLSFHTQGFLIMG